MPSPIRPPVNPLAQRAAIDALEAQRAAYRRYARLVEQQQEVLTDGDAGRASAFADEATRGAAELEVGASRLVPLVEEARAAAGPADEGALRRLIDDLTTDARRAELAIRNLSAQLEAWRDAYGRELGELGIVPGGGTRDQQDPGASAGYGRRARPRAPSLVDRRG
jgi:hypothetical protein